MYMNSEQLFEIISEWNFWNKPIPTDLIGFKRRNYLDKILPLIDTREVLILSGARRSGKSTLAYQIINSLKSRVDIASIFYLNFEDYRFAGALDTVLLERLTSLYFEKINPQKKPCYFFWDEVQNVENFEKFLRTIYDQKRPIKFIISGSNSKIAAGEIADLLTGRNITTTVYPFSFSEYLEFRCPEFRIEPGQDLEKLYMNLHEQKPIIKNTLDFYIRQGGYPEIAQMFSKNEDYQAGRVIAQYFEDIILKDVVKRYNLRNTQTVSNIARYCIDNIGNLLSYSKIADALQINKKILIEHIDYLEKAFFIFQNKFFSWKIKETLAANKPKKIYAIDHFYKVHMGMSFGLGQVVENIVFLELKNNFPEVFYWKERGEVDFIVRGQKELRAVQVSYTNDPHIREAASLVECAEKFDINKLILVTEDTFETTRQNGLTIRQIPLWLFLLADKNLWDG